MRPKTSKHLLRPGAIAVRNDLDRNEPMQRFGCRSLCIELVLGLDAAWVVIRLPKGGGYAFRAAQGWGTPLSLQEYQRKDECCRFDLKSGAGDFHVELAPQDTAQDVLRIKTSFTPSQDLCPTYSQRDLYVLGEDNDPAAAEGEVLAAQRGLNSGIVFLQTTQPRCGSLLYFQNFTELNPYFRATGTTPDSSVGGQWPELGYQAPFSETAPLRESKPYVVSDVFLAFSSDETKRQKACDCAATFLDLLGAVYASLDRPKTTFHDWPDRARKTLSNLKSNRKLTTIQYGHPYVKPYVNAEYPDSMVQSAALNALRQWEHWQEDPVPLAAALEKGLDRFFDKEKHTLRRYLPNVGADKDADEVDSWYLYHPLSNLGRLALAGDPHIRDLFLKSIDFGIKVAHHFRYRWPVTFKLSSLAVITKRRKPTEPGQSDVGGFYAYVMLQAYQMTADPIYLKEAKAALRTIQNYHFELLYQSNITSWGVAACGWLFKITQDPRYLKQSYIFLANIFHNSALWQSNIGFAKSYSTFFSVSCLHDGPYMAAYECYETFMALSEYIRRTHDDLPPSVLLLVAEHIKFGPNRAWSFYPDALPPDALSEKSRNGEIDRKLSIPLEDLYVDGRQAGTVGQEVYGCGAAFMYATISFQRLKALPIVLYCEYAISNLAEEHGKISFQILGPENLKCRVRLLPANPKVSLSNYSIAGPPPEHRENAYIEFRLRPGLVELRLQPLTSPP